MVHPKINASNKQTFSRCNINKDVIYSIGGSINHLLYLFDTSYAPYFIRAGLEIFLCNFKTYF